MPRVLATLLNELREDHHRKVQPFSQDIDIVNSVILHPYATDIERTRALRGWLQKYQPCLFGRIAAKSDCIDFCFLTDADLQTSDEHVARKIATARTLWKRRAVRGLCKHGFLLSVASGRVALAAPDEQLQRFAMKIEEIAGWSRDADEDGHDIVSEFLYLMNPHEKTYVKFVFSVDFFASAADGRWWHDHRIPGGIAFTANSLGHMVRVQEWYEGKSSQIEWALRTAMLTIDTAADTQYGRATWLLPVPASGPLKPFTWSETEALPESARLRGKDMGSYAGTLHTDHSVRREFFDGRAESMYVTSPWGMDFSYIYDTETSDHSSFMVGHPVTEEIVTGDLGSPDGWRFVAGGPDEERLGADRPPQVTQRIEAALATSDSWWLSDEQLRALSPQS